MAQGDYHSRMSGTRSGFLGPRLAQGPPAPAVDRPGCPGKLPDGCGSQPKYDSLISGLGPSLGALAPSPLNICLVFSPASGTGLTGAGGHPGPGC